MSEKVRKKVNWFEILWKEAFDKGFDELLVAWCAKFKKFPEMSANRIAYLVLKKYYSTTAMKCLKVVYKDL